MSPSTTVATGGVPSSWPLALLYDELWLRSHRVLVHRLETGGFWLADPIYAEFRGRQRATGERFRREMLAQIFSPRDYAYLGSEVCFGPVNRRFRGKLPYVLAFGHELGAGFARLRATPEAQVSTIAELCAVFNLGVSIFDLLYDQFANHAFTLESYFDAAVLKEVSTSPDACARLATSAEELEAGEPRLVLSLIAWFYCELHRQVQDPDQRKLLTDLLREAYMAELNSVDGEEVTQRDARKRACRKSTLPLAIIAEIGHVLGKPAAAELEQRATLLSEQIASIFWLVDDLDDLVRDLRDASLNAVAAPFGPIVRAESDPEQAYSLAANLLGSTEVEWAAEEICANLRNVREILTTTHFPGDAGEQLYTGVLGAVRNWMM